MNMYFDPKETDRVAQARDSFAGRLLTDTQFNEAMAITGIIESEIKKSGTFREKLGDYAHASGHFYLPHASTADVRGWPLSAR